MLIPFLRSSLLSGWEVCQTQCLLTYAFGFESKAGAAASGGSCVHKSLELRALGSMHEKAGRKSFVYDDWGEITTDWAKDLDQTIDKVYENQQKLDFHVDWKKMPKSKVLGWAKKAITDYPQYDPVNLNILEIEKYFDMEIKEDWAKYKEVINGVTYEGYLRIKGTIDCVLAHNNGVMEVFDYKGLPVETPIPTPDGWSTMGDLKIGDIVYDQFGNPTKVIAKSKKKIKECYEVTFDDTSKVICDDEHYWKLSDGSVVQIQDLKVKSNINTAKPIICEEKTLPIDPYLLGVWLGDGRNRHANITSGDQFVFEEIKRRGYTIGENTDKGPSACEARTVYDVTHHLRALNLLNNKHIPKIYLRSSYQQRLDLLRGLMDSDGSANICRKQAVFTNCNKTLSSDIKELLLTLGQRPLMSTVRQTGFGLTVTSYPVSFRPVNINPFLLPIKSNKIDPNWGVGGSYIRTVTKIEKIDKKLTQCISVDSPDKTYLCTKNMIPTHNTGSRKNFANQKIKDLEYLKNDTQLLFYLYALSKLFPDKSFIMSLYFINDGGIYSVIGDNEMLVRAEKMIKKTYGKIKNTKRPTALDLRRNDFRCKHCCEYSKPGKDTGEMSVCEFMRNKFVTLGMDKTVEQYADMKRIVNYGTGAGITRTNDDSNK